MNTSSILATVFGAISLILSGYIVGTHRQPALSEVNVADDPAGPTLPSPTEGGRFQDSSMTAASERRSNNFSWGEGYDQFSVPAYRGSAAPLRLQGGDKIYATRLTEQYDAPVNFGGSLVLDSIGCGAGCTFWSAIDKSSGRVLDFPLGGEENMMLQLTFRKDSSLVWAVWRDATFENCMAQPWSLGATGFRPVKPADRIECRMTEPM